MITLQAALILFLTLINEISWRYLQTEDWVFIKVFVLSPLVGIFMFGIQTYFLSKIFANPTRLL